MDCGGLMWMEGDGGFEAQRFRPGAVILAYQGLEDSVSSTVVPWGGSSRPWFAKMGVLDVQLISGPHSVYSNGQNPKSKGLFPLFCPLLCFHLQ